MQTRDQKKAELPAPEAPVGGLLMCRFCRTFPILDALRPELSWTHYCLSRSGKTRCSPGRSEAPKGRIRASLYRCAASLECGGSTPLSPAAEPLPGTPISRSASLGTAPNGKKKPSCRGRFHRREKAASSRRTPKRQNRRSKYPYNAGPDLAFAGFMNNPSQAR